MTLNIALVFLLVMLTLDCLYVAALLVVDQAPRVRKWLVSRPSPQPTAAPTPSAWRWPENCR